MRKLNLWLLGAVFACSSFGGFPEVAGAAEETKIGYADISLIFDSYNKTKEQDAALSSKGKSKQEERDKIVEKIRNMKSELELLNDEQREKRQTQIDEEIIRLQDFDRVTKNALRRERDDMVRTILKEIDAAIEDFARKNGYTVVLNSRALVYARNQYDITQEILKILNSRYKKKQL